MRILGIDPGFGTIGFAILDIEDSSKHLVELGVIKTDKNAYFGERLKEIYTDMQNIIAKYKPQAVAIEKVFFSKNITTGIQVSEAKGVILLALAQAGLHPKEYSPSEMKAALTGDGKANKTAIQKMLKLELRLNEIPKPDDAADALSLALTLSFQLR